jgi:hypothetical protein
MTLSTLLVDQFLERKGTVSELEEELLSHDAFL